jgi:integrase
LEKLPHTRDHRNCPSCKEALEQGAEGIRAGMPFRQAAKLFIAGLLLDPAAEAGAGDGPRFISERTESDLRQYARAAGKFFDRLPVGEIHLGHLRAYQRARLKCDLGVAAWEQRAGANLVRKEVQTVMRVMRAAGLWTEEMSRGMRLVRGTDSSVAPAISSVEQQRLLAAAARRPEWELVHWHALVALQTTASTDELRGLRLEDVTTGEAARIAVRGKNKYRNRIIPVTSREARWALGNLVERARRLGANPDGKRAGDFLFPLHITADRYDARQPMTVSGLRKRWEEVREAAGLPKMRLYDLRHAGLTRMAEAGAPIHVMMSFAGHMSIRMQRHYVAISMASKTEWAERIWGADDEPDALPPKKGSGSVRVILDDRRNQAG